MSLDGFVAGPRQSVENPLGVGGMRVHEWVFPLAAWRATHGLEGGEVNESTAVVEESLENLGATIMGRNMFGGHPGPWNRAKPWNGWWGNNPPYHHPVFVLTHHAREPLAAAEEDGRKADVHLVDQARGEILLRRPGASGERYVLAAGRAPRLVERLLHERFRRHDSTVLQSSPDSLDRSRLI